MFPILQRCVSLWQAPVPSPSFQYGSLPATRSFRVFQLLPSKDDDNNLPGDLRGRIAVMNLDDGRDYNALSYCWGGSIEPSPYVRQGMVSIVIEEADGRTSQLLISPALATALRYLREQEQGSQLPLFIDQICINQADDAERSQQVGLMGDIYRNCRCVVAWLDVATRYTDELFDYIPCISDNEILHRLVQNPERVSALMKTAMQRGTDVPDDETLARDAEAMITLTREHWARFPHRGFFEVCMRRWFRRIWIVQEACLGNNMVFVCGWRSCSAEALGVALEFNMVANAVTQRQRDIPPTPGHPKWHNTKARHKAYMASSLLLRIFNERVATLQAPSQTNTTSMRRGLDNLVIRFNVDTMAQGPSARLGSSDPKDYIYALKGLTPTDDPVATQLLTDYALPTATIFTSFTRLLFLRSPAPPIDTLFLSRIESKTVPDLPTWVPDWSSDLVIPHGYRQGCFPVFNAGKPIKYDTTTITIVTFPTPTTLRFSALPLCAITSVGEHYMKLSLRCLADSSEDKHVVARSIFAFFRDVQHFCQRAAECINSASIPSAAGVDEAVWITSTGGHGLTQTTERSLLGRELGEGRTLLGALWELQLKMDVLPEILGRRREGVAAATDPQREKGTQGRKFLGRIRDCVVHCIKRLAVELICVYRLWKYACGWPYVAVRPESEDMLYHGIFGMPHGYGKEIGTLKSVLFQQVGRKCFVSEEGHVGLGPVGMREGDVVVVPLGASHPAILRPAEGADEPWEYVGEAYCHGFMEGEAFTGEKVESEWFVIK
ncbi:heterokaryon incompatibility protein-domain-containing protein [Immersiella caudata]|uniref:Heterokaryon incompatibility protein-domain-containing protein n=1 Tax=Immersiella caudata TaxID=314043 RepID=A0AA40CBG5_9PEZI|nr:heterokaryon incompatibility protein-domain-containing protein [Immersiella caudata]